MADNNVNNVALGIGGRIWKAPLGTPIPADVDTPLNSAFENLGHVSSEGFAREISRSYTAITSWDLTEVANQKTEETLRGNFTLIESSNPVALKAAYGDDAVSISDNLVIVDYEGREVEDAVYLVETEYKGARRRLIFERASNVTEDFSQTFTSEDVIGLPISLAIRKVGNRYFRDIIERAGFSAFANWAVAVNSATGGTFTLSLNGFNTAPIAYDATAAAVQSAINGISGITGVTATVTGTTTKAIVLSEPADVVADDSGLEGSGASVTVSGS